MVRILSWCVLNILAFYAAVVAVPGLNSQTLMDIAIGGLMLAVITGVGGPIARLITFPVRLATLGLFTVVVNFTLVVAAFWLSTRIGLAIQAMSTGALLTGAAVATVLVSVGNVVRKGLLA